MTYRLEKETNGEQAIVISGWDKGIAPDPYSGLNKLYSVNLTVPGEVSVGYPITNNTISGGTLGQPVARATRWFGPSYGSGGTLAGAIQSWAVLDSGGQVFEATTASGTFTFLAASNSTSGSSYQDGIAFWSGYLLKSRGANLDYWNGSAWTTGWKTTLTAGVKHFMYVGSDNVLYITNGNFVASLSLATPSSPASFDPTNSATYTFTTTKLQLPATDMAISLAEVGGGNTPNSTLLVGGVQYAIYPWDKTSPSFALPIYVAEPIIANLVSVNQNAFIFAGSSTTSFSGTGQGRGRIFITNGSQAQEWFKMPDYLFGGQDPYYTWGDAIFQRNQLIFGCFVENNSATLQAVTEIWAIDLGSKAFRSVSTLSTNGTGGNATVLLSSAGASASYPGLGFIVGSDDGSNGYAIGRSSTAAGTGNAIVTTDLIPVGTFLDKRTYTQVEIKLRTPLAATENIVITPIIDGSNGTNLTFSPSITTGSLSAYAPVTWTGAQWLQLKLALTGASNISGVRLYEIRIR